MTDATEKFFDELGRRGHEARISGTSGTIRCDLTCGKQTDHWLVTISNGDIAVARVDSEADAVIRAEQTVFDQIVSGEMNFTSAFYRGALASTGDFELICVFERLFPGPPSHRERRSPASAGRRQP